MFEDGFDERRRFRARKANVTIDAFRKVRARQGSIACHILSPINAPIGNVPEKYGFRKVA
ncbi:hypothetical protein [Sphingobium cloacae]|uniref:hypothetical protein n=1 Tax=Sphingobium cloacae TaxID=120107 RepID=UPI000A651E25|nr:hypothetical protein [Sphingobium cloacae]